jgi:hypothetical protein
MLDLPLPTSAKLLLKLLWFNSDGIPHNNQLWLKGTRSYLIGVNNDGDGGLFQTIDPERSCMWL